MASRSASVDGRATRVSTALRAPGAVASTDTSRSPISAMARERGIGVAVRLSTWQPRDSRLRSAFWAQPKRCSSSTTTRARSAKATSSPSSACVPTTTRASPDAIRARAVSCSDGLDRRDSSATGMSSAAKRSSRVRACWRARMVVGAIRTACRPAITAAAMARSATSVLPYPTSPTTSLSAGASRRRSDRTAAMARAWSAVSSWGNPAAKASYRAALQSRDGARSARRARPACRRRSTLSSSSATIASRAASQSSASSRSSVTSSAGAP